MKIIHNLTVHFHILYRQVIKQKLLFFCIIQTYVQKKGEKYWKVLINSSNLVLQPYPFNGRVFMVFSMLGLAIICNLIYTFNEVKIFTEYTKSIFMTSLAMLTILALLITVLSVKKLFKLIDTYENIVNTKYKWVENRK